jgi:hypothetical protein
MLESIIDDLHLYYQTIMKLQIILIIAELIYSINDLNDFNSFNCSFNGSNNDLDPETNRIVLATLLLKVDYRMYQVDNLGH